MIWSMVTPLPRRSAIVSRISWGRRLIDETPAMRLPWARALDPRHDGKAALDLDAAPRECRDVNGAVHQLLASDKTLLGQPRQVRAHLVARRRQADALEAGAQHAVIAEILRHLLEQ